MDRANFYDWQLVNDGNKNLEKPVQIGKARSTLRGNRMNFRATKKGPVLFKFRQFQRLTNKPVFFVYGSESDDDIFYTIKKTYHWGASVNDPLMGAAEKRWKHMQKIYIYAGKLTKASQFAQATPLYEGFGQKSKYWKFYKYVKGQPEQVGVMNRMSKDFNIKGGFNRLFELTIDGTNVDAGAIMTAITVANLHQNSRSKGQHRLFDNGKFIVDVVG